MSRVIENFKSFILTVLIISSLILTGSLWFDNYQGLSLLVSTLPINIVNSFSNEENSSIVYDDIILPYKVTVINPEENKWIFYQDDIMAKNAWKIVKDRLNSVSDNKDIITGKIKEWENLIDRKSIILEFGGNIEYDILKLVIPNLNKESNAFNDIEKIALTKSLEGNNIYILQNSNGQKALYKVLLKGDDAEIESFMDSCENVKTDAKYVKLIEVGTTKFFNEKEVVSDNSVLFPIANTYNRRNTVSKIEIKPYFNINDEYSINRFIVDIFKSTDFAKFVTTDMSNIFINDDKSSVKFENNGVIEYINNGKLNEENTSASRNFNEAVNFINNIKVYPNMYLINASESEGIYTFRFALAVNGKPIGFKMPIIENDFHTAFEVKVKNGNIIYFKGKLLDIELTNIDEYITSYTHNILDDILNNVEPKSKVNVSDLELMYVVDNDGIYYPSWISKYKVVTKSDNKEGTSVISSVKK